MNSILSPKNGATLTERDGQPVALFALTRLFGRHGKARWDGGSSSPALRRTGIAEFTGESSAFLQGLVIVECRVVVVIGNIVEQLCSTVSLLGEFLTLSVLVVAPDLASLGGLLPHVVEPHDVAVLDGADMFGDTPQLRAVLGYSGLEQLDFFGFEVWLLQIIVSMQCFESGKGRLDIKVLFVQQGQGLVEVVCGVLWDSFRGGHFLGLVHILVDKFFPLLDGEM